MIRSLVSRCLYYLQLSFLLALSTTGKSQKIMQEFTAITYTRIQYDSLRNLYGHRKTIPSNYESPILIALSFFPELKNQKIIFRIKSRHTPLRARPKMGSVLKHRTKRTYIITISDSTDNYLTPILLKNMPFNAQVGVLGHELSHIAHFAQQNILGILCIGIGNTSTKFLDRFEYETDSICLEHKLGYQLLSWSSHVRKSLLHENWNGADNNGKPRQRERYMNPSTINKRITASPLYNY